MTNNPCISPLVLSPRDASHIEAFEPRQLAHSAEMLTLGTLTDLRICLFEGHLLYMIEPTTNQDDLPHILFPELVWGLVCNQPNVVKSSNQCLTLSWVLKG